MMSLRLLRKLWWSLPYDGQGLEPPRDITLARLRHEAAADFWTRTPRLTRPLLITLTRAAWVAFCLRAALRFPEERGLLGHCIRSGAHPNEAFIWSHVFSQGDPHPLPGRAAGRLLSRLGCASEHRMLADKLRTAELLAEAGLPAPHLVEVVPRGRTADLSASHWSTPDNLFVKPRHGAASRGAMIGSAYARSLSRNADDLLVQERLRAARELSDLAASETPPVLRLTTARFPGEAPFLHSALLSIDVPGEPSRNFIRGQMRVPIEPATGTMRAGLWFLHPDGRYTSLPWNQAPLCDRRMPGFECAAQLVLRAMALFPCLPLVNWDLIVTPSGPVILEGNTCGDWILTNLSSVAGIETLPVVPLLDAWAHLNSDS